MRRDLGEPGNGLGSNTSRGVNTTPAAFARATNWIDMMLSPPRREERVVDTEPIPDPSTSANSPARTASIGGRRPRARLVPGPEVRCRAGALRSSLPLGVSGSVSRTTSAGAPCTRRESRRRSRAPPLNRRYRPFRRPRTRRSAVTLPRADKCYRRRDAGAAEQGGFDLAEFDAETTDLHLEVAAAQVLQLPVGRSSAPGHPCGTSAPRAAEGSATNRAAVRPARPR